MALGMVAKVEYELMTPAEIVEARSRTPVAFVPIGPIEWHGPHLPFGTDAIHARHVALRVAREVGGIVLPAVFFGTDTVRPPGGGPQSLGALGIEEPVRAVGMDLPGYPAHSLYLEASVFGLLVREIIRGLKADPFRLIVLVNGHGAPIHVATLQRVALEESDEPRVRVLFAPASIRPRRPGSDPGHAERWETSIMMAIEPGHVRVDRLPEPGVPLRYRDYGIVNGEAFEGRPAPDFLLPGVADPRHSTRAEGEEILAEEVRLLAGEIRRHLGELA